MGTSACTDNGYYTVTVIILCDDIGMEFVLDKCATIKMKRGKLVEMERVTLAEGNEMSALEKMESTNNFLFKKEMTSSMRR